MAATPGRCIHYTNGRTWRCEIPLNAFLNKNSEGEIFVKKITILL
jgi:hypothetical protein